MEPNIHPCSGIGFHLVPVFQGLSDNSHLPLLSTIFTEECITGYECNLGIYLHQHWGANQYVVGYQQVCRKTGNNNKYDNRSENDNFFHVIFPSNCNFYISQILPSRSFSYIINFTCSGESV